MATLLELESRIKEIEERNKRVELDKAWNDSWTRRFLIAGFTYFSIALYFKYVVGIEPWINAVVPSVGFLLSTLSLPFIKEFWIRMKNK